VRWQGSATVVSPIRFAEVASTVMRIFAEDNVELARRRAAGEL
jgi:hypothetical protein